MIVLPFVVLACGGSPPPHATTASPSPAPTPDRAPEATCDAVSVRGQTTDCTALDFCEVTDFDVRLACCDCDPVYCDAPASIADCYAPCDPAPVQLDSVSCLATDNEEAEPLSTEPNASIVVAGEVTSLGPTVPPLDLVNEVSPRGCSGTDVQLRFTDDDGNDWMVGWGIAGTDIEDESLDTFVVGERIEVELARLDVHHEPYTLEVRGPTGDLRFVDGDGTRPSVQPLIGWRPEPSVLCSVDDQVHMDMVATYQGESTTMRAGDVAAFGVGPEVRVVLTGVAYNPAPLTPYVSDWMAWRVVD
ncbi:MAG: hypothetical protein AAF602_17845 [Myxococcota bacterium]